MESIKKVLSDLFKEGGKWSIKRVIIPFILVFAYGYVVCGGILEYEPQQYVFDGSLIFAATLLGMTVANKHKAFGE